LIPIAIGNNPPSAQLTIAGLNRKYVAMRSVFILSFVFASTSVCNGQQWVENQIDSVFAVSMPDEYDVVDTLGQQVLRAEVPGGLIMVMVMENNGNLAINVNNEKELRETYKGFQQGMIKAQGGEMIGDEIRYINGLTFSLFSYHATLGNEKQVRYCLFGYVNKKTYAVNFWELESMTSEMAAVREQLFKSVRLAETVTKTDQYLCVRERFLVHAGYWIGYLLVPALVIFALVYVVRRLKSARKTAK
jgi:hypothetical protein